MSNQTKFLISGPVLFILINVTFANNILFYPFEACYFSEEHSVCNWLNIAGGVGLYEYDISNKSEALIVDDRFSPFTKIPKNFFKFYTKVTNVSFNHGKIEAIEKEDFLDANYLIRLDLGSNSVTTLSSKVFEFVPELVDLQLPFNKIAHLEDDSFDGLKELKVLSLIYNNLTTLPPNIFSDLRALERIELQINHIQEINDKTFENNLKLKHIDLESNEISSLSSQAFLNLYDLEDLYLSDNDIIEVHTRSLKRLIYMEKDKGIKKVHIHGSVVRMYGKKSKHIFIEDPSKTELLMLTDIDKLNTSFISDLINLKYLELHGINLNQLTPGLFTNLNKVEDLAITFKDSTEFTDETVFNGLINVRKINFKNAHLTKLNAKIFSPMIHLEEIDFRVNSLQEIENPEILTNPDHKINYDISRNNMRCEYMENILKINPTLDCIRSWDEMSH